MSNQNSIRLPGTAVRRFVFGGKVPGYVAGGRVPVGSTSGGVRRGAAPPPSPLTPGSPGGLVGGIQQSLGQFNQQFTQPIQNIAGQVSQFNPFAGVLGQTAEGSLSGLLKTGLPTDVSGLTDVAAARAGRQFEDFLGSARERFGALNLGSSSALEAAKAREAARLAQGVAEQGIISGVGAQEAARGRQLGAFNPFLGANEQALQARLGAGGLFSQAASAGFQPIQGALGLSGQLIPPQAGELRLPPAPGGGAPSFLPPAAGGPAAQRLSPLQGKGIFRTASAPFAFGGFQGGGRVDFGDFLSNLLFGQQFTRRAEPVASASQIQQLLRQLPRQGAPQFAPQPAIAPAPRGGIRRQDPLQRYIRSFVDISAQMPRNAEDFFQKQNRLSGLATAIGALSGAGTGRVELATPGGALASQPGLSRLAQLQRIMGVNAGLQATEEGGMIEGPSQPPDIVPIMAQGGEVILPLETVARLKASKSKDPLIKEIKRIARRTPDGQAAHGGGIQAPGPSEFLRSLQEGLRSSGSLEGIPGGTFDVSGDVPSFSITGMPEEEGAQEERDLLDAIRGARARVNRLAAIPLTQGTMGRILPLVEQARSEVAEAEKALQVFRGQKVAKEQATAQKEFAAAQKERALAERDLAKADLQTKLQEQKTHDQAIQNIITSAAKQGGDPLAALSLYFQAKGLPLPTGLQQAIAQQQQAAAQPPAPVTEALGGDPQLIQQMEALRQQQEQENRILSGMTPTQRVLAAAIPGSAAFIPEQAQQTPPLEFSETDAIEGLLSSFEAGQVPPENMEEYKQLLGYLASRNLDKLSLAQRQRLLAVNRELR